MIKRSLFIMILALTSLLAKADGDRLWTTYTLFSDEVDNIAEAQDKVYYRSGSRLFSYSPSDAESYVYLWNNRLSDIFVKEIYYNAHGKYLLVVYENSNIDLIFDDGAVVNLPEVKNSSITDKTINNVDFSTNNRIVLATAFGYVIYNDQTYDVEFSASLGTSIKYASALGDNIVLVTQGADNAFGLYIAPISSHPNNLSRFTKICRMSGIDSMNAAGDDWLVFRDRGEKRLFAKHIDLDKFTEVGSKWSACYNNNVPLRSCKDGWYSYSDTELFFWDPENFFTSSPLPEEVQKQKIAFYSDPAKIWTGTAEGIARYDISGTPANLMVERMRPANALTVPKIAFMRWNKAGTRLWLGSAGFLVIRNSSGISPNEENGPNMQYMNSISNGTIREETLIDASHGNGADAVYQKNYGNKRMYANPAWMIPDPDDDDFYFQIAEFAGVYGIKDTHQKYHIYRFPVNGQESYFRTRGFNIDPEGNIWLSGVDSQTGDLFDFYVLSSDKRREIVNGNPSNVKWTDWKPMGYGSKMTFNIHDHIFIFSKKYNYIYYVDAGYAMGFTVIDHNGTYADSSDDKVVMCNHNTDQDGNSHVPYQSRHIAEDANGALWVASNAGVYVIDDPRQCFTSDFRVRRPKVPRNDGTNYADYLLDTEVVNYIAVDPANRKWIATDNSGLYLVNADGTEIIEHFTTDNSPLPSNTVYSVECDPYGNTVYVGTTSGLMSFQSNATPPASDFSDILAYPNPVRPEYTGYVTITGLKDNSLVKIADSLGNVFYQTRSEGGMAQWDACDASGRRVKSGVYYVFVSATEGASESNSGAVTKIMVIN